MNLWEVELRAEGFFAAAFTMPGAAVVHKCVLNIDFKVQTAAAWTSRLRPWQKEVWSYMDRHKTRPFEYEFREFGELADQLYVSISFTNRSDVIVLVNTGLFFGKICSSAKLIWFVNDGVNISKQKA